MTKKRRSEEPEVVLVGSTPIRRITAEERREIAERIKKQRKQLREKYPEVHGKVVDFITHTIDDGTLYFTVRFKDQTSFSLRYACDMFIVGADLSDWGHGNYNRIREYMKPIPR
jgi:hypothetical protein